MASPIEDYALISDLHTGALLSRDGSMDWLCFPRYDSGSSFAALLGTKDHGRWLLAPSSSPSSSSSENGASVVSRTYIQGTFVLQTQWRTDSGEVLVTEFMPVGDRRASVIRRVEGISGRVTMGHELEIRFGYGSILPWVSKAHDDDGKLLLAIAGPDALVLRAPDLPKASGHSHIGEFTVEQGQSYDMELVWYPSHREPPRMIDVDQMLKDTVSYWQGWSASCVERGRFDAIVQRSLLVLRALTHEDTGGIVAAATTSLPETFGGERNWDYRYCWLRDAALTLTAMMTHGLQEEALQWRNWLLRAIAGDPADLQIMYGVAGERRLPELELKHLPGYADSTPVRIGNGAVTQYQADVVGEVMVALEKLRELGVKEDHFSWPLQRALLTYVEENYAEKDHGIWEMRGEKQYFTHSRVMMWAALNSGVRAVLDHGLKGPVEKWKKLQDTLHEEIMEHGYNREIGSFTQTYGSTHVDASLLQLPQVGFIDYDDELMLSTVERLEKDLVFDSGLILRYRTDSGMDGLSGQEYPFLACSFWLVEQYARSNRYDEADGLMNKLVGYCNELGLMSEEYDTEEMRMAGNFPQAFSHLALVRAADAMHGIKQDPKD